MKRSQLVVTFVVALLIAGAASLLVVQKLRQSAMKASAASHRVVTAARNIDIGSKLSESDLRVVDWVGGSPSSGTFTKASDIAGRAALYPIFEDELVLEAKLAPVGSGAGLPAVIPAGMRAVSIRVDDVVAVAGFVGPGTRVDVLLTGTPAGNRSTAGEALTRSILENVQVLAAGEKIQPDSNGKPEKVNVVTLLCNPEDAAKVTLAANEGRIQLILRNPTDTLKTDKQAMVGRQALYGGEPAPKPSPSPRRSVVRVRPPEPQLAAVVPVAPAPPAVAVKAFVEVVRGEKVSRVEVPISGVQGGTEK